MMCRVEENGEKSEVCQASTAILIDQDVELLKSALGSEAAISAQTHTPFRSPCIIPSPCMYSNPRATSSSYKKGFHR